MKMNKKLLVLSATFALAAQFDSIATAAEATGDAIAVVITPLTITADPLPMSFGTIAGGSNSSTILMSTAGALTPSGDAQIIGAAAGTPGKFTITGEGSQNVTVSVPLSATLTGDDVGASTMTIALAPTTVTQIPVGGTVDLLIGGTLSIGANQPAGNYSTATGGNSYNVTVNYD